MRALVLILCILFSVQGRAEVSHPVWDVSEEVIGLMERRLSLPSDIGPLGRYRRWYSGILRDGEKIIVGKWLASDTPGIIVVDEFEMLPLSSGGGCSAVTLIWNVGRQELEKMQCELALNSRSLLRSESPISPIKR